MTQRRMREMVLDQDPVILPLDATVKDASCRMRERRVGAVLVVDERDRLVGIFTGRDAVCRVLAEGRSAAKTVLRDVMTPEPGCMDPERTAIEALRLMQDGGYRHVPIMQAGRIVGIVSRGDFRGQERARLDEEVALWERI